MIALLPGVFEMAYDEIGTGSPLLLIHGWPHTRSLWAGQMSGLATHARCIAPDLRGFGASTETAPFTIDQYADDLAALLDSLGIARAVIGGLSMGGYVALAMQRRHRDRVRALVLADTRASADTPEGIEKRMRLIEFIEQRGMDALATSQLDLMLGATTRSSRPELCDSIWRMIAGASSAGAIGALRAMAAREDSTAGLGSIDVPTLVLTGAEDIVTPPEEARAMTARIPRGRFALIAGAGHLSAYERPGTFNHLVTEFLHALPAG